MTGPEHYREAERILAGEVKQADDPNRVIVLDYEAVVAAQVHATLALAAATALNARRNGAIDGSVSGPAAREWAEVLR